LSSGENIEKKLYEELIDRAVESLLEIHDALWIYDFERAYELASKTVDEIKKELRRVGLTIDLLMDRARSVKRKIGEIETIEIPGHEMTILAPIISRLIKIQKQVLQIVEMQRNGALKPPKRLDGCAILNVNEIYLARCRLQRPLVVNDESEGNLLGKALEKLLMHALNPVDLEVNTVGAAIEAHVWLQNMVIDIMMAGSRLEIRVLASPKARDRPEEIENAIKEIRSLIEFLILFMR